MWWNGALRRKKAALGFFHNCTMLPISPLSALLWLVDIANCRIGFPWGSNKEGQPICLAALLN